MRLLKDPLGDFLAADRDGVMALRLLLKVFQSDLCGVQLPVGISDHIDQLIRGDEIAHGRVDDVVQPADGIQPVVDGLEELDRVGDPPAGERVHPNERFVEGRNLPRLSVPFQDVFVKDVRLLNERQLELQPRVPDGLTDNPPELGDHHLFGLIDGKGRVVHHDSGRDEQDDPDAP